jgi:hypothetical protein
VLEKPARETAGFSVFEQNSRARFAARARNVLLIYPNDPGSLQLSMLFLQFSGCNAQRNCLRMREIRKRSLSLCGGVTSIREDALFMRQGRVRCVCRMVGHLRDLRLAIETGSASEVLRECACGGK